MCLQDHFREASLDRVKKRFLSSPDFSKPYCAWQKRQPKEMTHAWPTKQKTNGRGLGRVILMYLSELTQNTMAQYPTLIFFFKESTMEKALSNLGRVKHLLTSVRVLTLPPWCLLKEPVLK